MAIRDSRESLNAYMRKWQAKNRHKQKDYDLRRRKGINLAQYQTMLQEQNNRCAICNEEAGTTGTGSKSVGSLAVDHCHVTQVVRGLLCTNCNLGLGSFRDKPELLRAAANYIARFEGLADRLLGELDGP